MFKKAAILFISITLANTITQASTEEEREALTRLVTELESIEQIIRIAEQAADQQDRQRFNYTALRQDLALIRDGINKHLHKPRFDPYPLPPITSLNGDYR